jgi:hypothetical protein
MYTPTKYHAHTTTGVNILYVVGILYAERRSAQPVGRGKQGACDTFLCCWRQEFKMRELHVTLNADTERQSTCEEMRIVYY